MTYGTKHLQQVVTLLIGGTCFMSKRNFFLTNKCWLEFGKQMFWPNIYVAKRLISQKRINQIDLNLYCPKKKKCIVYKKQLLPMK
jgi:hypothetical protein